MSMHNFLLKMFFFLFFSVKTQFRSSTNSSERTDSGATVPVSLDINVNRARSFASERHNSSLTGHQDIYSKDTLSLHPEQNGTDGGFRGRYAMLLVIFSYTVMFACTKTILIGFYLFFIFLTISLTVIKLYL